MKNLVYIIVGVVVLFGLLFGINQYQMKGKNDNPYGVPARQLNPLTVDQLNDPNYQNIIVPSDLKKKMNSKEPAFVYFYSPDCVHCKRTTPTLYPLSKQLSVDMKQFNLMEYRDGWDAYKIESTPTLVYYKGGVEVDRLVGEQTAETFTNFFNKYKTQ